MKRCKEILIAAVFAMIAFSATAILPKVELQPFCESETRRRPKTMGLDDIIGNGKKANEPWTGLDPSKYSDLAFYNADGRAHIKGKLLTTHPVADSRRHL